LELCQLSVPADNIFGRLLRCARLSGVPADGGKREVSHHIFHQSSHILFIFLTQRIQFISEPITKTN